MLRRLTREPPYSDTHTCTHRKTHIYKNGSMHNKPHASKYQQNHEPQQTQTWYQLKHTYYMYVPSGKHGYKLSHVKKCHYIPPHNHNARKCRSAKPKSRHEHIKLSAHRSYSAFHIYSFIYWPIYSFVYSFFIELTFLFICKLCSEGSAGEHSSSDESSH